MPGAQPGGGEDEAGEPPIGDEELGPTAQHPPREPMAAGSHHGLRQRVLGGRLVQCERPPTDPERGVGGEEFLGPQPSGEVPQDP